jgi:hypothetical protein
MDTLTHAKKFESWLASANDPYEFVVGVLGYAPPGTPDAERTLERWQAEALQAIRDGHKRISIRSGHGVGKTTFLAWLVLWAVGCHLDCKVPFTASSQDQLRDIDWPEIKKQHRLLPPFLRNRIECQAERIVLKAAPDVSFAVRRTATAEKPEAIAGFHADFLVIIADEASGIPEEVFETGQGALSTPGAIAVLTSNPTRRSGFFFDTHHKLKDRWWTLRVSSEDVPRARGHIEDVIATYGKNSNKYRVRVLGEFPTSEDDVVIPMDVIEAAIGRQVQKIRVEPIWGLDVGRHGDDPSALAKRQGNWLLEPPKEWQGLDGRQLANRILEEWNRTDDDMRPCSIMVDVIGVGASAYDFLVSYNLPAVAVNVAESASTSERYLRLRSELWFKGREWFMEKNVYMPKGCDRLAAELAAPKYDFNATGQIVVEKKEETKKELGRSTNQADAFLLTFARPDQKMKERKSRSYYETGVSAWAA